MNKIPKELIEITSKLSRQNLRLLACDCAEHVLPLFENFSAGDKRPRKAIEIAQLYAQGQSTIEQLQKAAGDAEAAAWEAGDAAWKSMVDDATPSPECDAAAPAAGTAGMCCNVDPVLAVEATMQAAIEVVVTAAVGSQKADNIWGNFLDEMDAKIISLYQQAEDTERAWQLSRAQFYLKQI
jgi:hypothetical protein